MGEYGPAVDGGKVRYLSASQLTSFDAGSYAGCARRWWFKNVARRPEGRTIATDLGTKVHAQIEHYLRTGEDVLGEIARAGKRFIPRPGPDLMIEVGFGELRGGEVASPLASAGVPFVGRIDLMHRRGEWLDDDGVAQAEHDARGGLGSVSSVGAASSAAAEVVDWKTTKRIADEIDEASGAVTERGYAKSGEELAATWQMVGYSMVALAKWPDVARVRSSHGYFQTRGRREASKRSAVLSAAIVRERWSSAEPLVERVKSAAGEPSVERVSPNYEACGAYGGCPHRSYCPRDGKLILAEALGRGGAMSLLAKIKADREAAAKGGAAQALSVKPEVAAEVEKLKAEETALRSRASAVPPDAPAPQRPSEPASTAAPASTPAPARCGAPGCGAELTPANSSRLPDGAVKHVGCSPSAAPAAVGPCPCVGAQVELTIHEVASKKRACACGATVKVKPQEMSGKYFALIPKHDRPGTPAAPKPETPKIKITEVTEDGKRTAIEPPKGEQLAMPTAPTASSTPTSAALPATARVLWSAANPGITFYVDAIEDGVAPLRLEAYADKLAAALAEQYKAADIRCAPADSPLSFGKWKGALAALVRAEPPAPGAYAVSSGSEIGMVAFDALAASAARVVRGVR